MLASESALQAMDRLEQNVRQETRRLQSDAVAVRSIGPVKDAVEAAKRGSELGADLVVWGWTGPGQPQALFPSITKLANGSSTPELGSTYWMASAQREETVAFADEHPVPSQWLPRIVAGVVCHHLGDHESAVNSFTVALEAARAAGVESVDFAPLVSSLYLSRGRAYIALGHRDLAADDFIACGRILPSAMAQVELGNVYFNEDSLEKALRSYRQAMALDPYYLPPYVGVGNVHRARDEDEAAMEQFEQALRIRPDYAPAYFVLGELYRKLGEVLLARDAFNKSIVLAKDDLKLKAAGNEAVQALAQIRVTPVPAAAEGSAGATAVPQATAALGSRTYVVKAGDNLTSIALLYDVSVESIVRANNLRNANTISVGQELIIPSE